MTTQCDRVKAYIDNVEQVLQQATAIRELDPRHQYIIELARGYTSDAKYYLEKNDCFTSLACIAYAEGLLDSLRYQGVISFNWKPLSELLKRPRVLVAGSFEFLHPGHIYLLKRAWELGEVYVVVSRNRNFTRFKGREPVMDEKDRLMIVENVKYVSKAVMGDEEDFLKPIVELKPDIVLLGPDQWIQPDELKSLLEKKGLSDVRVEKLESRIGEWSSSRIIERIKNKYC